MHFLGVASASVNFICKVISFFLFTLRRYLRALLLPSVVFPDFFHSSLLNVVARLTERYRAATVPVTVYFYNRFSVGR